MKAKLILGAQVVLLGAGAVVLLLKELPGIKREIRILRMIGPGTGPRHSR